MACCGAGADHIRLPVPYKGNHDRLGARIRMRYVYSPERRPLRLAVGLGRLGLLQELRLLIVVWNVFPHLIQEGGAGHSFRSRRDGNSQALDRVLFRLEVEDVASGWRRERVLLPAFQVTDL